MTAIWHVTVDFKNDPKPVRRSGIATTKGPVVLPDVKQLEEALAMGEIVAVRAVKLLLEVDGDDFVVSQ